MATQRTLHRQETRWWLWDQSLFASVNIISVTSVRSTFIRSCIRSFHCLSRQRQRRLGVLQWRMAVTPCGIKSWISDILYKSYPWSLVGCELVLVVRLERRQREHLELLLGGDHHAVAALRQGCHTTLHLNKTPCSLRLDTQFNIWTAEIYKSRIRIK